MNNTKLTKPCQEYVDLQRQFVEWCVANGHQHEAAKVPATSPGPDDFQWQNSKWAPEFARSLNQHPVRYPSSEIQARPGRLLTTGTNQSGRPGRAHPPKN